MEGEKENSHGGLVNIARSAVVAVSYIPLSRGDEEGGREKWGVRKEE